MSFNQGLMGVPSGSAMNAAGLMMGAAARSSGEEQQPIAPQQPCEYARSTFTQECVQPTQLRENALGISVMINGVLTIVIVMLWLQIRYISRK